MTQKVYRAGILGLGFVGGGDQVAGDRIGQKVIHLDGNHREAYTKHPRFQLVAGCDLDAGNRERFAERTGARPFDDWRKMLADAQLDILSVATSSPLHAPATLAAAEAGIRAVYVEKPIATSLSEADAMLAACQAAGSLLVVNHNRRFNPNYRRLRDLIAAGELGELLSVYLRWSTGRLGCVGTHLIDAARMLTSRELVGVSGTLDSREKPDCRGPEFQDPGCWGLLRLEGELMIAVNAPNYSMNSPLVSIEGSRGVAETGGDAIEIRWRDGRNESWPGTRQEKTSMDRALDEIAGWLDGTMEFPVSPREGGLSFEAIAGFHVSHAARGAWVELPLQGKDRDVRIISG